jgi:hypothetical protein
MFIAGIITGVVISTLIVGAFIYGTKTTITLKK